MARRARTQEEAVLFVAKAAIAGFVVLLLLAGFAGGMAAGWFTFAPDEGEERPVNP